MPVQRVWKAKAGPEPRPAVGAFTLIELLVVMAIIGLLISLVFSMFGAALSRARSAKCMSNLKSMGQGLYLYAGDHDGCLVDGSSFFGNRFWFHELEPYLGAKDKDAQSLRRPDWQLCPAKHVPITHNYTVGYGWNFRNFGYTPREEHADWGWKTRLPTVPVPGDTVIIGDSTDWTPPDQPWRHPYLYEAGLWTIARRHQEGQHSLFLDASVQWLQADVFQTRLPLIYRKIKE